MPPGVVVHYWLKEAPKEKGKVTLEFLDGDTVIRTFTSEKPAPLEDLEAQMKRDEEQKEKDKPLEPKAGLNRFVWDMRVFKPTLVPKAVFNEGTRAAPKVAPGSYKVRLKVGDVTVAETIEVRPHPAGYATAEDLKAQYDLLKAIRDRLSETHETVLKLRDLKSQIEALGDRAQRLGKGDSLQKRASALANRLTAIEEKLTNPRIKADEDDLNYEPQLDHDWTYLAGVVSEADARPTPASVKYYELLKSRLQAITTEFQGVLDGEVASFNKSVEEAKIPPVASTVRTGS